MEFNIKQIKAKWKKLSGSELGYKLTNHSDTCIAAANYTVP